MKAYKMKMWASLVLLVVGLCVVGCSKKPTPEQVAERTKLLFDAIESNDVESAKVYITSGANLNAKQGEKGITPLIYAIQTERVEMVDLLIASKADLQVADTREGRTPLLWAVYNRTDSRATKNYGKNAAIIALLIQAGADVQAKDAYGYTPITYAERDKDTVLLAVLKDAAEKRTPTAEQRAERTEWLFSAINQSNVGRVRLCLLAGADVNGKKEEKDVSYEEELVSIVTPLITAIQKHNDEIVDVLIKAGADVNEKNKTNSTPWAGNPVFSPLAWAISERDERSLGKTLNIVEMLINAKAKVNEVDFLGFTPLMRAVYSDQLSVDIVALLIKAGANVNHTCKIEDEFEDAFLSVYSGCTPLMLACQYPYSEEEDTVRVAVVEQLINAGAKVNEKSDGGFTALHYAVGAKNADIVALLIKAGADVNAKNKNGYTVLKFAMDELNEHQGRAEDQGIISLLKAAGAKE